MKHTFVLLVTKNIQSQWNTEMRSCSVTQNFVSSWSSYVICIWVATAVQFLKQSVRGLRWTFHNLCAACHTGWRFMSATLTLSKLYLARFHSIMKCQLIWDVIHLTVNGHWPPQKEIVRIVVGSKFRNWGYVWLRE